MSRRTGEVLKTLRAVRSRFINENRLEVVRQSMSRKRSVTFSRFDDPAGVLSQSQALKRSSSPTVAMREIKPSRHCEFPFGAPALCAARPSPVFRTQLNAPTPQGA